MEGAMPSKKPFPIEQAAAVAEACSALAHPMRPTILRAIGDGELSPVQAAARLERSVAATSHHFHVLRNSGLIYQSRTRPARGTIEHLYKLTDAGAAMTRLFPRIAGATAGRRGR
jgi:DNA-binding transcriptional ArsR family regulator